MKEIKTLDESVNMTDIEYEQIPIERKLVYIISFLLVYDGKDSTKFCNDMGIDDLIFTNYFDECKDSALLFIKNLKKKYQSLVIKDKKGNKDELTIGKIKEKIIKRINDLVEQETDPSKLARSLEILSLYEAEQGNDMIGGQKSIYDDLINTKEDGE